MKISNTARSISIMIGVAAVAKFAKEDSALYAILFVLMMIFVLGVGDNHE